MRRSERVPASGSSRPASSSQQRRFAGAVGADQADALAGAEVERQVGEQRPGAEALGQVLGAQQDCHSGLGCGSLASDLLYYEAAIDRNRADAHGSCSPACGPFRFTSRDSSGPCGTMNSRLLASLIASFFPHIMACVIAPA